MSELIVLFSIHFLAALAAGVLLIRIEFGISDVGGKRRVFEACKCCLLVGFFIFATLYYKTPTSLRCLSTHTEAEKRAEKR